MKRKISKFFKFLQKGIERKHYLEFITAALSIPVLLTVLILNLNNLNHQKNNTAPTPTPQTNEIIIHDSSAPKPTDIPSCKKVVGPVLISNPKEGATITDNPVNFIISYSDQSFCSVVWSYRINNGTWSEYSSNSPSIYNMPNGQIKFDLRIQSTVSQDQQMLTRNFNYQGSLVSPTTSPAITPSVSPTP